MSRKNLATTLDQTTVVLLLASGGKMKSLRGQALGVAVLRIWNRLQLVVRNKADVNHLQQ